MGEGGFAWVFQAQDGRGKPVAIKILKPQDGRDAGWEARFEQEVEIAATLTHENVVGIEEVGRAGSLLYFAMKLFPDSLAARLKREGRLEQRALVALAGDLAQALVYAHSLGIIHRDIKPGNILLRADGRAALADFGIARAVTRYIYATGVRLTIGTPAYVSPEQAQGGSLDGRSDLYSLGITLYHAATEALPFRSRDWYELARLHVEEQPEAPRSRCPSLDRRCERMILRCLAKHPDDRFQSAKELLAALRKLQDED